MWCGATKALDEARDVASDVNMRWWVKRELEIEVSSLILLGRARGGRRKEEDQASISYDFGGTLLGHHTKIV